MSDNLPEPANKEQFMEMVESLRPELLYPDAWSDEQQKTLDRQGKTTLRTKKAMFASIPMLCAGSACPIKDTCPLYAKNIHPLNKKCPIESQYVMDLAQSIMMELSVDPDDLLEVSQVRALVNQEIQYMRATGVLATDGFIQENVVGVNEQGEPIMKKELSLAVELEDRVLKRIKDLKNQLLATRESKVKAGQIQKDAIAAVSDLFDQVNKQDKARQAALKDVIDVAGELED